MYRSLGAERQRVEELRAMLDEAERGREAAAAAARSLEV